MNEPVSAQDLVLYLSGLVADHEKLKELLNALSIDELRTLSDSASYLHYAAEEYLF